MATPLAGVPSYAWRHRHLQLASFRRTTLDINLVLVSSSLLLLLSLTFTSPLIARAASNSSSERTFFESPNLRISKSLISTTSPRTQQQQQQRHRFEDRSVDNAYRTSKSLSQINSPNELNIIDDDDEIVGIEDHQLAHISSNAHIYTNQFVIESEGSPKRVKRLAYEHGFEYLGHVSLSV